MTWHTGHLVGLDTETTGPNPLEDRIVTASVVHVDPGSHPRTLSWYIDPGVPVPDEAAEIHGWTTERIQAVVDRPGWAVRVANGRKQQITRDAALFEIAAQVAVAMHADAPLVVANGSYDLTLLELELLRHDIDTLSSRPTGIRGVVDPMVLEKAFDPYRKVNRDGGCQGSRRYACGGCGAINKKLGSLCQHYGLRLTAAHSAGADALAAIRLAVKYAELWPEIARWRLPTLHGHQVTWRRHQMDRLRDYFDKNGTPHDGCDPGWPLHTSLTLAGAR